MKAVLPAEEEAEEAEDEDPEGLGGTLGNVVKSGRREEGGGKGRRAWWCS